MVRLCIQPILMDFVVACFMTLGGAQLMFAGKIFQMFPKDRELNQILKVKVK